MKSYFAILAFGLSCHLSVEGQNGPLTIEGTIIDQATNEPIPYATVMVSDKTTDQMITGTSTEDDGSFRVESSTANVTVTISFMGYESKTIENISKQNGRATLGTISLKTNS